MNIIAIVQARLGSTRLPNKVLKKINDRTLIDLLLTRLSQSKLIDKILVAIPSTSNNDNLSKVVKALGFDVFRGEENDVLDRFYNAAKAHHADVVVRITGDCPLVDSGLVDSVLERFKNLDYMGNVNPPTYPDGLDIEVFTFQALELAYELAIDKFDCEHVTPFIRNSGKFRCGNLENEEDLSRLRWTVDEPADFEVVSNVFNYFHPDILFGWKKIIELSNKHPKLFLSNKLIVRNEGAVMTEGQKLWKRAKQIIPGGNMLLSKRAEMFLPDLWPAYFSKAKGCTIWDLDGREYVDMSIMGIGTNILGYGHPRVDQEVMRVVSDGNMSTFNCPEEVYLAEKLIELHPWADMVRFARTGGEANAVAIRIARAATGKDNVAICGYHGWHDWYLSANLGDDQNLSGHLLPGLNPSGVPHNLRGTVFPFSYNNLEELESLVKKKNIGIIKMEVVRNMGPENNFLQKVRSLANEHGIVLIFDECTSGFRQTYGGLHKLYGVEPDMAMFGKALGNGYAITAIVGKRGVMEAAQSSFISSTFWTERIGPSAGLKTLEVMNDMKSWDVITSKGKRIKEGWKTLADSHQLKISQWGLPALAGFTFESENNLAYKTLITQEMLKKGYLAGNSVYVCTEHKEGLIENYFNLLDPIFALIKRCEEDAVSVADLLDGPICHGGFKRLN